MDHVLKTRKELKNLNKQEIQAIVGASCGLTFSVTSGFVKKFLKTIRNKKNNKIVMLARSKLNSIESTTSKALMDNEISHEDFQEIINE